MAGVSIQIRSSADQNRVRQIGLLISAQRLLDQQVTEISDDHVRTAEAFWVAPLLAHQIASSTGLSAVAPKSRETLRQHLCFEGGFELLTGAELRRVVAAAAAERIDLLLMKGAALAYLYYPASHLRPRLDTDLLIRAADRSRVADVLVRLGYQRSPGMAAEGVAHQDQYTRALNGGLLHAIDVHWKIANPLAFADLLAFDELAVDAVPIPALGGARAPAAGPLLLLLALHRIAHHERDLDLLCMYDMHRVARTLTETQWADLIALAESRMAGPILAEALHGAGLVCPTPVPPSVARWIDRARHEPLHPVFASFAQRDRRVADVIASDVRAARDWRTRLRILREHVFPPAAYMKERFGVTRPWILPYLYVRRLAIGIPAAFRRGRYR